MGTRETYIIYRLVMRNSSYDAFFSLLIFWATFGGKLNVVTTRAPNGLGPPETTKKLAIRYPEIMFSKFSGVKPPFLNWITICNTYTENFLKSVVSDKIY